MRLLSTSLLAAATLFAQIQVPLEHLDLTKVSSLAAPMGYPAKAGHSVAGTPLTIKGKVYEHGVGLHSGSKMLIDLHGQAKQFTALAGLDEVHTAIAGPLPGASVPKGLQNHPGLATVEVWVDGKQAFDSGVMRRGIDPKNIAVDLTGAKKMLLVVTDGGRWPYNNPLDLRRRKHHYDFGEARCDCRTGRSRARHCIEPVVEAGNPRTPHLRRVHGTALLLRHTRHW